MLGVALGVDAGDAEQIVGEVGAGLGALEHERSVVGGVWRDVDLVEVDVPAELQEVAAEYLGVSIRDLESIVGLTHASDVDADGEVVEGDVLDPLDLRCEATMPGWPFSSTKPWEASVGPTPPTGWLMLLAVRM